MSALLTLELAHISKQIQKPIVLLHLGIDSISHANLVLALRKCSHQGTLAEQFNSCCNCLQNGNISNVKQVVTEP